MKIDFKQNIPGLDGKPLLMKDEATGAHTPITLGGCCINALFAHLEEDNTSTGEEKQNIYIVAKKVYANEEVLSDDIVLMKKRIAKFYLAQIAGPCWFLLEQKEA